MSFSCPVNPLNQGSLLMRGDCMKQTGDSCSNTSAAAAAAAAASAAATALLLQSSQGRSSPPDSFKTTASTTSKIVSILHDITSSQNEARNQAEQAFNGMKDAQPEALLYGLLEGLGSKHLQPHVRGLAAVLLRRALLVEEPTLWECLPPAADMISGAEQVGFNGNARGGVAEGNRGGRRELQACLLQILSEETDGSVRRQVGDLVGELGRAVLDEDGPEGWPEFLPYVLESASATATNGNASMDTANAPDKGNKQRKHAPDGNTSWTPPQATTTTVAIRGGVDAIGAWDRAVTGLRLMSSAAEHVAMAAAADPNAFQALVETLQRCLCWQGNGDESRGTPDVRMEAVRALGSVVVSCAMPSEQAAFATCLPHLLQAIQATLASADRCSESGVWYCCETLELVIELAEAFPSFLRPRVSQCVSGMVQVAADASVETSVRLLALEFLVTIVEASPAMCRKMGTGEQSRSSIPGGDGAAGTGDGMVILGEDEGNDGGDGRDSFATNVIPVCFAMMTELPENDAWASAKAEEGDSVEDSVCEVGCEALERVARALGARAALPVCRRLIKEGLGGWSWQQQHAGLWALGVLASVYNQVPEDYGIEIKAEAVSQLLPFFSVALPRVQHAALWSLERIAEDQSPDLPEEHYEAILPALLACLDPARGSCPRVLHRALLALAQVVEACPEGGVMSHAEVLLERCVELIRRGPLMVQEAAVSLVSAAAEAGDEEFGGFYNLIMPFLTQILTSCQGTEQRLLRGKTLECVSLIGSTVSKERFSVDALSVMQMMVHAQASGLDDDDPTRVYMLRAWVRICKCLGSDFVPYLPLLMPPLIAAVSANVEVELPSAGGGNEGLDVDDLDSDVDCMEGLDGEVVAVRTWALEEQATACQMILLLAEALQEHFLPYVEAVAGPLARLVNSSPHDDVRSFCMAAMPELLRSCGKAAVMPGSELEGRRVHQLLEFCLCRLLESLDHEEDAELLMTAAQACKRCVNYACVRWELHTGGMADPVSPTPSACRLVLNESQSRALAGAALGCLGKSLRRRALRRAEATASEDWDEEEEERSKAAGEEEVELHVNLAELLGSLFKTHGQSFLPAFNELLLPSMLEMARPESLSEDKKIAVHVLDHALEFASPAASSLLPSVVPLLLQTCTDEDPSVSLPALFGVGVSAATYGAAFEPFSAQSLQVLVQIILRPDAREDDRELATDNAVSALGNLLEAQRDSLCKAGNGVGAFGGLGKAWDLWLGYMPLEADDEEAEKVAMQLCRLLTNSSREDKSALLGSQLERLPAALTALAQIAESEPAVRNHVGQTILALQQGGNSAADIVSKEAFVTAAEALGGDRRAWLDGAASEYLAYSSSVRS